MVAIGPGLGQGDVGRARCSARDLAAGKPLVIDADALNLLAAAAAACCRDAILTPHPGEAARLLGIDNARRAARPFRRRAANCAQRYGAWWC